MLKQNILKKTDLNKLILSTWLFEIYSSWPKLSKYYKHVKLDSKMKI